MGDKMRRARESGQGAPLARASSRDSGVCGSVAIRPLNSYPTSGNRPVGRRSGRVCPMSVTMFLPFLAVAQTGEGGLTWSRFLHSLPTDPASIFVLLLLAGSLALVVWAGRPKKKGG